MWLGNAGRGHMGVLMGETLIDRNPDGVAVHRPIGVDVAL